MNQSRPTTLGSSATLALCLTAAAIAMLVGIPMGLALITANWPTVVEGLTLGDRFWLSHGMLLTLLSALIWGTCHAVIRDGYPRAVTIVSWCALLIFWMFATYIIALVGETTDFVPTKPYAETLHHVLTSPAEVALELRDDSGLATIGGMLYGVASTFWLYDAVTLLALLSIFAPIYLYLEWNAAR